MFDTRTPLRSILIALVLVSRPALGAGAGESPGLFTGDLGNIIWTLLTFVAVVVVLGRFAWRPILNGLQAREQFIRKSLADAAAANGQAQQQLARYTEQLDKARADAALIVEEGRRDAEVVRRSIHEEAKKEADAMIARARREINLARDTAVRDLYNLGAALATDLAGRIISRQLNPADHERLIQESIAEVGKLEAESRP